MRVALVLAVLFVACAHEPAGRPTPLSRAEDAALERCVNELLASGTCAPQFRERALWRVKRVSVSLRTTLGTERVTTDARAGHRLMLGTVEGIVGFSEHGPVVLTLRRVPEGISVLGGDVALGSAMQELHERATIELPARITTVEDNAWSTFTIELVREVFERNDPPSVPLTSS